MMNQSFEAQCAVQVSAVTRPQPCARLDLPANQDEDEDEVEERVQERIQELVVW